MWSTLCVCFFVFNHQSLIARCEAKRPPSQAADAAVEGIGLGGSFVDVGANSASPNGIPAWGIAAICLGIALVIGVVIILVCWMRSGTDDDNSPRTENNDSYQPPPKTNSDNIPSG
ncbi:uncharacterized protein LOC128220774 [Mya arenaria]|uniref:uncharacterized protein LOC128220774 n=1 Tax=Mya arenaria TaxID=6604 RepID=UPI0022E735C6|nr:uncharacterized protein LOC128220774 [Mya arenaria]